MPISRILLIAVLALAPRALVAPPLVLAAEAPAATQTITIAVPDMH